MPDELMTISAKVSQQMREKLDEIRRLLQVPDRSSVIRLLLRHSIVEFDAGRVPLVCEVSKTRDAEGREVTVVSVDRGIRAYTSK